MRAREDRAVRLKRKSVDHELSRHYIHDLNSHIWDAWADENGSIGKAYGYQLGVRHKYAEGEFDQVDRMLFDLKNNPNSRCIMSNISSSKIIVFISWTQSLKSRYKIFEKLSI